MMILQLVVLPLYCSSDMVNAGAASPPAETGTAEIAAGSLTRAEVLLMVEALLVAGAAAVDGG